MDSRIERILMQVEKPARYTGGEVNQIIKNKDNIDLRVAFCFPDTYEIGMSNLGMSILYHTMNSLDYVWCERVFAPWGDMAKAMTEAEIPSVILTCSLFPSVMRWPIPRFWTCSPWHVYRFGAANGKI